MAQAATKQIESANFSAQNGHAVVRLVSEADPDGRPAMHQVALNQRCIDALFETRRIDSDQHQAGTMLRDSYERGKVFVDSLKASGSGTPIGGGEGPWLRDEDAWNEYQNAMQQLGRDYRSIVRAVAIEDRSPEDFGRQYHCSGVAMLKSGLDRLVRHYGLVARR